MPDALTRLVVLVLATAVYAFSVHGGIINGSPIADTAAGWGPAYFATLWVSRDSQITGYRPAFHYLFWVWALWPILLPHYVVKTRGRSGAALAVGLWVLLCVPAVGAFTGWWFYDDLPDFR